MLTQKLTKGIALTATIALLAGCTPAGGDINPSASPSAAASVAASSSAPSAAPSASVTVPSAAPTAAPTVASAVPSGSAVAPTATPVAGSSTTPSTLTGDKNNNPDISQKATLNGKVYDTSGISLDGVSVTAMSVDPGVTWAGTPQQTSNGAYVFQNAPVGVRIQISIKKDGYTTATRTEVLKSNLTGDPLANVYDFGYNGSSNSTDANALYAIQNEPQVTMMKINGRVVTDSDSNGTGTSGSHSSIALPDNVSGANLTGISGDKLVVEMTFSEPVRQDDVQNYFRIVSGSSSKFNKPTTPFTIDQNLVGSGAFSWNADGTVATFTTPKAVLANNNGDEARYLVNFSSAFRDKTDTAAKTGKEFKFSSNKVGDYTVFSVKNQDTDPQITSVQALDGNGSSDYLIVNFSKSLDVINSTVPQVLLNDPSLTATNTLSNSRLAWNTGNGTNANNSTLFGFTAGSPSTTTAGNYYTFQVARLRSADVTPATPWASSHTIYLNALGTPSSGSLVKSTKINGSQLSIELDTNAFDKNDKVLVTGDQAFKGTYNDSVNNITASLTGTSLPSGLNFFGLTDTAGRTLDTGNSTTSSNVTITNGQKVATAN